MYDVYMCCLITMCRSVGKELIAELNTIRKQFADACKLSTESLELPDTDDDEASDDAIDSRSPTVDKTKTRSQKRKENEQTDDQNNGAEEKKKKDDKK